MFEDRAVIGRTRAMEHDNRLSLLLPEPGFEARNEEIGAVYVFINHVCLFVVSRLVYCEKKGFTQKPLPARPHTGDGSIGRSLQGHERSSHVGRYKVQALSPNIRFFLFGSMVCTCRFHVVHPYTHNNVPRCYTPHCCIMTKALASPAMRYDHTMMQHTSHCNTIHATNTQQLNTTTNHGQTTISP